MNETSGFNPLNCNPHHELLVSVKHALAQCSSGDRTQLFETRERLHELSARVQDGSWSMLGALTSTVEMILGHLLRRGSLDVPELMQVATDVMEFVDRALTLPPPEGSRSTAKPGAGRPARLSLDGATLGGALKLQRSSLREEPLEAKDGALVSGEGETGETKEGSEEKTESTPLQLVYGPKRTATDFGTVAYQMVNESRLGELLIKMGQIQPAQLDRALVLQKLSRKRLGDVLMAMEAVDLRALQSALEVQRQETLRFTDERSKTRPGSDEAVERAS